MNQYNGRSIEILLVEDNFGDVVLIKEAFSESGIENNFHVSKDGEEALAFLRKEDEFSEAVTPDLIFLDLNLPKKDGCEVLEGIKADSRLRRIPVVMLSSSNAERDIAKAYDLHANAYVIKPVDLAKFIHVARTIEDFWFTVAVRLDEEPGMKH